MTVYASILLNNLTPAPINALLLSNMSAIWKEKERIKNKKLGFECEQFVIDSKLLLLTRRILLSTTMVIPTIAPAIISVG